MKPGQRFPSPSGFPVSRNAGGFTLVELLTVISILGVLGYLLSSGYSRVRQRASLVRCTSNLRQMSTAFNLYAAEHNGVLPAASVSAAWPMNTWYYQLQPYLEQRKTGATMTNLNLCFTGVFRCPGKPNWGLKNTTDVERTSYAMNAFAPEGGSPVAKRLTEIPEPARTMLVIDTNSGSIYVRNRNYIYRDSRALWHQERDNVLFVDGHVEAIAKNGLDYQLLKPEP